MTIWAVPLIPGRLDEVVALARCITFRVLVESESAVDALERAARAAGLSIHAWLEVDCGYHRSGVDPDGAAATSLLYRALGALTGLPIHLTAARLALVLALTAGMCSLAALVAIRKVAAADPAELF